MDAGSELPVESLESVRVTQDCLSVDFGEVLPDLSPVVSARAAAVSMSLPAITEVVSSAVFAGGGGLVADAADVGTVTVGVSVLRMLEANFQQTLLGLPLCEWHPWPRLGRSPWMWSV